MIEVQLGGCISYSDQDVDPSQEASDTQVSIEPTDFASILLYSSDTGHAVPVPQITSRRCNTGTGSSGSTISS